MRRGAVALMLGLIVALAIVRFETPQSLEEGLVNVQLEALMPGAVDRVREEPFALRLLLLQYAQINEVLVVRARLVMGRYGDLGREVLIAHGREPGFQEVLLEFGEQAVLPIAFFRANALPSLTLYRGAGAAVQGLRERITGQESAPAVPLDPDERGRYAIRFLASDGYGFLGQFLIAADGSVARIQTERFSEGVMDFLTSGLRGLETRLRTGEEVRAVDAAWAALDVAIAASALKVLRLGQAASLPRAGAAADPVTVGLGSTLLGGSRLGLRVAQIGGPVALAWIVIQHPSLLNAGFGHVAEALGYPVWVVQFFGWVLLLAPLFWVLQWLLRPVAACLRVCGQLIAWCDRTLARKARRPENILD